MAASQERRDIGGIGRTLWEMFNNRRYAIDTYQREYKWQPKQVVEMLEDLSSKFLEDYEVGQERSEVAHYGHYFLGSIILSQKNGVGYIIDGQQRLTTLTLLLIYLNRRQHNLPEDDKVDIENLILTKKFGRRTFNLDVPERSPCLEKLCAGEPFEPTAKDLEAVRNMVARYKDTEQNFSSEITDQALPYFLDWLLNNVHVVEITAYSDDDAYTIFETMNDRGLSLAPLDMLKGYVIANISGEKDRERINGIWKHLNNELLELGKEEPSDAVKAWLRSQYADSIRDRKKGATPGDFDRQGTEFHRWVRDNEKRVGLAKSTDFVRFVDRELSFYVGQYHRLQQTSWESQKGLENVYYNAWLGFTLQYPLLLAPLTPDDKAETIARKIRVVATFLDILLARRRQCNMLCSLSCVISGGSQSISSSPFFAKSWTRRRRRLTAMSHCECINRTAPLCTGYWHVLPTGSVYKPVRLRDSTNTWPRDAAVMRSNTFGQIIGTGTVTSSPTKLILLPIVIALVVCSSCRSPSTRAMAICLMMRNALTI
jgi:hypothetical protein